MADKSVFEMSGPAREKLAALQSISHTDRFSTYDQELSKIVCSFIKPLADAKVSEHRAAPKIDAKGFSDSESSRPLPFSLVKPAESWSEVGVRTVADLKSVMYSKHPPEQHSQISDRGVDWQLRSSLYANIHSERKVRLSYRIPGLEERAHSPPLDMDSCTNLTSVQVLDAMKVLSPPIKLTACKPYTSPKSNTQPRPEGKLPLNNLPTGVPSRKKSQTRSSPPQPVSKPKPAAAGKARMKFTKRRSDLEKNPLTGLLEPRPQTTHAQGSSSTGSFTEHFDMPFGVRYENNNTNYFDHYCSEILQELKPEYESPTADCAEGVAKSTIQTKPYLFEEGSIAPVFPETIEHASRTGIDELMPIFAHDNYLQRSGSITTEEQQSKVEHQAQLNEAHRSLQQNRQLETGQQNRQLGTGQRQLERLEISQQNHHQPQCESTGLVEAQTINDATIEDIDDVEFFEIVIPDNDKPAESNVENHLSTTWWPHSVPSTSVTFSDAKPSQESTRPTAATTTAATTTAATTTATTTTATTTTATTTTATPTATPTPLPSPPPPSPSQFYSDNSNEDLMKALVPMCPIFLDDNVDRPDKPDNTRHQTQQQLVSIRDLSCLSSSPKPKPINLFELYEAVTNLKTPKVFPASTRSLSQNVNPYLVRGQLALLAPEGMLT